MAMSVSRERQRFPTRNYPYRAAPAGEVSPPDAVPPEPNTLHRFVLGLDSQPRPMTPEELETLEDPSGRRRAGTYFWAGMSLQCGTQFQPGPTVQPKPIALNENFCLTGTRNLRAGFYPAHRRLLPGVDSGHDRSGSGGWLVPIDGIDASVAGRSLSFH